MKNQLLILIALSLGLFSCTGETPQSENMPESIYKDTPFLQDYSIKYDLEDEGIELRQVVADRNGVVKILSSEGLLQTRAGQFLFPGQLVPDPSYRTLVDKNIAGMTLYRDQFVYVDDQAVLSNAWAGELFAQHALPAARILAGGADFHFLISDGSFLQFLNNDEVLWRAENMAAAILDIQYDPANDLFWALSPNALYTFSPKNLDFKEVFARPGMTCFSLAEAGKKIVIGTPEGYLFLDAQSQEPEGDLQDKLPATEITTIEEIDGNLWFGSTLGAFMLREDGKFNYYHGERWLPGSRVVDIAPGPDRSVLILTENGLGAIHFTEMTLEEKAAFYEKQVRERHIRLGFNATLSGLDHGDLTTGHLSDSDNDGLWTGMYLGGQAFRYAVTQSEEALQNCRESLDAMERLYTINPVPGFPSRSFERSGYLERLADPYRWRHADDLEWDWKATTSSDEAIGHIFAFGVIAELVDDAELQQQAIRLIDTLMQHVVDNDFYLVDYDGQPTTWGRWNPEYVNARLEMVGDRKLNSSNIIGMLQTAYHFTKKEIYKEKAFELMEEHGYLENLMRPMAEIGKAPEDADRWDRMLSENWNHSDDEMYYMGYWGLYRYAFNDSLKAMYRDAIIDHWEAERPEKEGLWNIFTALVGGRDFDLETAAWYLREYPLDLIHWTVQNSHRQDIEKIEPNFREQTTKEVLPPDELRIARHNANRFVLDGGDGGRSEYSAGDIWLLPYWMGRYLGIISKVEGGIGKGENALGTGL